MAIEPSTPNRIASKIPAIEEGGTALRMDAALPLKVGTGAGAAPAPLPIRGPIRPIRPIRPLPLGRLQTIQANAAKLKPVLPSFVAEMSPASRQVPYFYGLDYGVGVDTPSGTAMNVAVTGSPSSIPGAGGSTVAYTMNELTTEEDLQTALGVSVEANGGIGLFSASARMDYAKSCQMNSSSVFLLVNISVTNAFEQITAPGMDQAAATLLNSGNTSTFQQQYGDMFVRGLLTGGQFFGVIEIETSSETDQKSVSAQVSAAYGPFGGSGSFSDSFKQAVSNRSVKVTCYIEGGVIPNPLPYTVDMLMQAASSWPQSVANNAVPYTALLDSYSILPLPNPPNYINLQQQQDVLNQCSWWRNQDIQTLNDISYIKSYPVQFVNPNLPQLDQWTNQITQDLNTIAGAASNALNNPTQAALPVLLLPPPVQLPQRAAGAPAPGAITVPNLYGMYLVDAWNLLGKVGFYPHPIGTAAVSTQMDTGHVFDQSPAAGTPASRDTDVSLTWARNPNEPLTVPNIIGLYMEDAGELVAGFGLNANGSIVGTTQQDSGYVFAQSPGAGTVVSPGSTLTFEVARNPNDE